MGLCKCPKRKVTNLFCYEHRVNVCEYCLVQNHSKVCYFSLHHFCYVIFRYDIFLVHCAILFELAQGFRLQQHLPLVWTGFEIM